MSLCTMTGMTTITTTTVMAVIARRAFEFQPLLRHCFVFSGTRLSSGTALVSTTQPPVHVMASDSMPPTGIQPCCKSAEDHTCIKNRPPPSIFLSPFIFSLLPLLR